MLLITQIYQGPPIWWTGKSWTRIVPKTMAIITGEFNIDDLFPNGNQVFGQNEAVYIIFLIFVIFCCHIVLMNVFTGLAVGDVATVMRIVFAKIFWLFYLSWPQADQLKTTISEAEQIKARYQMKLVSNMRINYGLFYLLKCSDKTSESSESALNIQIVNSGMLTFSKCWRLPIWIIILWFFREETGTDGNFIL